MDRICVDDNMARIEVISTCLVGMASIGATPMSRLDLTPWDLQLLQVNPMQRGLIFHNPQPDQRSNYLLHLKDSFSRALDFFPPLAGRIAAVPADDKSFYYSIDCNNAGAEFSHADAAAVSISDILEPKHIPDIVSDLFPLDDYCNCDGLEKPLIGVRITQLADGVFVGCTANHAVVDGVSLWHFINSWSELSRGSATISKLPVFERWFPGDNRLFPLPPLEKIRYPPPPLAARMFRFSKESLGNLKSKANSEAGTDKISTLQALSAHLWRATTRCRHSHGEKKENLSGEEVRIMIAIGARARIPLPEAYFGNAFNSSFAAMNAAELLEGGLGGAALKINDHVAKQSREKVIETVERWVKSPVVYRSFPPAKRSTVVMIASSPRHDLYASDFGWGKPIAAVSGKIERFDGNMKLYPAAADGGMDVEVCLAPETLQAMEEDAEFMAISKLIQVGTDLP